MCLWCTKNIIFCGISELEFLGKSAKFCLYLWTCPFLCVFVTMIRIGHSLANIKSVKIITFVDFDICHRKA